MLFIHLFKTQNNIANQTYFLGLISLRQASKIFETCLDRVKYFKYQYFLVTPVNKKVNTKICKIERWPSYVCTDLFRKFWSQSHFLMGNKSYVYKEEDLSKE